MLEDPDFVPFIRTWEWSGVVDCHTRPLIADDTKLVVAYGIRGVRENTYLTSAGFQERGVTAERVHSTAITHLNDQQVPPWAVEYVGTIAIAMRAGDEMVSADILNPVAMRELSDFFNTEIVYVGIPTLFSMVASAHPLALTGIATGQYRDSLRPKAGTLSSQVLILSNGHIVGSLLASSAGEIDRGWQAPEELAMAIATGLASISILVDRAKNVTGNSSASTFWPSFARYLGHAAGTLEELLGRAQVEFPAARMRLSRGKHLVDHIEIMAAAGQSCLSAEQYQRFAAAAIAAASTVSQAGTGFWGIGRTLPMHVRLTIQALAGLMHLSDAGPLPRHGPLP